jgi:membrane protein
MTLIALIGNEGDGVLHDPKGHQAVSPWQMPKGAWKDIAARTYKRTWDDNVGLVAAGVALYAFFALLSLLGALVLIYGFVADPQHVVHDFYALTTIFPRDVAALISQQLLSAVESSETRKGFAIVLALLVALYGGTNGAAAMLTALNIAYEEKEKRSLWRFYLLALSMALIALAFALVAIAATAGIAYLQHFLPDFSSAAILAAKAIGYAALLLVAAISAGVLYRFGPSRENAKWRWITPGSLFAAAMWLLLTSLFGFYVTSLTDYSATYGSLGAVVALLTWLYLSAYAFVFGAELNSEIEHQTAKDSTTGEPKPLGDRGAWAADNVASDAEVQDRPEEVREGERLTGASASIADADQP